MTITALNRVPDGSEYLTTLIEQAIEVALLIGVLAAVGAMIVWMNRWAGPRKTFIGSSRAPSSRAAKAMKRRERSA